MSIWCSHDHIGTDPTVMYEVGDGVYEVNLSGEPDPKRTPVEQKAEGGNVLGYAHGWSNHYPTLDGEAERPAALALAHIAPWCTPGHREEDVDYDAVGGWLRLEVDVPESLNFWLKDDDGPAVEHNGAMVVMDREAVTSLRDQLNRWLDRPHLTPTHTPAPRMREAESDERKSA